jgi:hypothetical protein
MHGPTAKEDYISQHFSISTTAEATVVVVVVVVVVVAVVVVTLFYKISLINTSGLNCRERPFWEQHRC